MLRALLSRVDVEACKRLLALLRRGVDISRRPRADEIDPKEARVLELPPGDRPRGPTVRIIPIKPREEGENEPENVD